MHITFAKEVKEKMKSARPFCPKDAKTKPLRRRKRARKGDLTVFNKKILPFCPK